MTKTKTTCYSTLEEAKKAVQKLTPVPISSAQYKSSYKQDSQLLSKPDRKYKGSWVDWYDFLGIQNPKSIIPYATIEEAKEIKDRDIAEALELPPIKLHCSVLAEDSIRKAIQNWKEKNESNMETVPQDNEV